MRERYVLLRVFSPAVWCTAAAIEREKERKREVAKERRDALEMYAILGQSVTQQQSESDPSDSSRRYFLRPHLHLST